MNILLNIIEIFGILILIYFILSALYLLIFSIAGHFYKNYRYSESVIKQRRICILVPAYKEDDVIIGVAEKALKQDYEKYELVIIADSFKEITLNKLKTLPLTLLEITNDKQTKANAIKIALNKIHDDFDILVILDGDNIIQDAKFLSKINNVFEQGCKVVQGHRTAKNFNTNFALLDALSEEINNHIFRKGHRSLGLSSALIGSAMAIDFKLFSQLIELINTSGEDKELEFLLLKNDYKIEYLNDAIVLDEKTQKSDVFVKQRSRWLANQFLQARLHFFTAFKALFKGKTDFFDKALQHFLLPRILLLGTSFIVSISLLIFNYSLTIYWFLTFFTILISLIISIPLGFLNLKTLKAISSVPIGYLSMIKSLFNMKGATKKFVVTEKNYNKE